MAESFDAEIAIVGAGVIGASSALRLAQTGADLLIFSHPDPARTCSLGNAGHIATEQFSPLASPGTWRNFARNIFGANAPVSFTLAHAPSMAPWLARFAMASLPKPYSRGQSALRALMSDAVSTLEDLLGEAGCASFLARNGHFWAQEQISSAGKFRSRIAALQAEGVAIDYAPRDAIDKIESALGRSLAAVAWLPETASVRDPESVVHALLAAAERAGAVNVVADITQITPIDGGFELIAADGARARAAKVLIAAGAWSHKLAAQLGDKAPLEAERGYHIQVDAFTTYADVVARPTVFFERNVIASPVRGGMRLAGMAEFGGVKSSRTARVQRRLEAHLKALAPAASSHSYSCWAGSRPTLPDYLPVIGPSRNYPNAVYAFGHQHLGLTLAGVTSRIVEDLLIRGDTSYRIAPFSVSRFQWSRRARAEPRPSKCFAQ